MNLHRPKDQQGLSRTDMQERLKQLPKIMQWIAEEVGHAALELNMSAYLVGGPVRDLLLKIPNLDLDFVVEGSAIKLAHYLQSKHPKKIDIVAEHDRFQTARVVVHDLKVDLTTARTESYEHPAALPAVKTSDLQSDLFRRDFTVNALAVCVNPDRYGELIDSFNGVQDLKRKTIRILHPVSFIDDPTRIIRAARFAARLGFNLDSDTKSKAKAALAKGMFDGLGGVRIKNEIKAILSSPTRQKALDLLASFSETLGYLDAQLKYDSRAKKNIKQAQTVLTKYPLANDWADDWIIFLGVLIAGLDPERIKKLLSSLQLDNDTRNHILEALELSKRVSKLKSTSKESEIYHAVHSVSDHISGHVSDYSIAIALSLASPNSAAHRAIGVYLEKLRNVQTILTGDELLKMGLPKGQIIGQALALLKDGRLDGVLRTRNDEIGFIKKNFLAATQNKP